MLQRRNEKIATFSPKADYLARLHAMGSNLGKIAVLALQEPVLKCKLIDLAEPITGSDDLI